MKKKTIPKVSTFQFIKNASKILKNPLPFHKRNFTKKGDTFKLVIGLNSKLYFSRDAKLAEYVLQKNQKNYTKSKIQTEDLSKYVGKGLLTAEGEHWKKQRKLIQPAFHKKQLENLLETVKSAIVSEYENIEANITFDVFPMLNDLAFQTVVKSLFSSAANQEQINRLQYITESVQKMLIKELRQPHLSWWFKVRGNIKEQLELSNEARDILKSIVNKRKESGERHDDLLDMLLETRYEDGSAMEERQLIDEILILFTAGHETTSNALTFTFQLLAQHPEWQDKIYEELNTIEANSNDLMLKVTTSKQCQQVIEESMRLYPPVYFLDRVNLKEDTFNGVSFEAGSNFLFSVFEMHRHPELWENPEAFYPERFIDGSRPFSAHYFPFGAGPRKCIGNNFAMFEMILAIGEIVKTYKIHPEFEVVEMTPLITLKPKNAFLKFEKRVN